MAEYFKVLLGLALIGLLGLATPTCAQYIYEGNQSLVDLTNQSGTTNLNSGDDQVSSAFSLGFNFDFYNQTFSSARMATNGCLHFKTSGAYCSDYTPDPLANQYTYTMLPFWTDLIRDNGSKMLAKSFNDMTVFGWYDMREYNRASDNSFEVILWTNDTFEYRYGALDIINHDVLIGEVGSGSSEVYQYLYHDECNTGSTNSSSCVNTNWNDTLFNDMLENGRNLFGCCPETAKMIAKLNKYSESSDYVSRLGEQSLEVGDWTTDNHFMKFDFNVALGKASVYANEWTKMMNSLEQTNSAGLITHRAGSGWISHFVYVGGNSIDDLYSTFDANSRTDAFQNFAKNAENYVKK